MDKEKYKEIVKKNTPKEKHLKNLIVSFVVGGLMGVIGELITEWLQSTFYLTINDCYMYTMIILVVISSILTGLGFFDSIVSFCKAGLIVPTTGFAHAMTSSAMDYRKEGLVKGIGSCIFKLTGSIILYGLLSAVIVVLIRVMIV